MFQSSPKAAKPWEAMVDLVLEQILRRCNLWHPNPSHQGLHSQWHQWQPSRLKVWWCNHIQQLRQCKARIHQHLWWSCNHILPHQWWCNPIRQRLWCKPRIHQHLWIQWWSCNHILPHQWWCNPIHQLLFWREQRSQQWPPSLWCKVCLPHRQLQHLLMQQEPLAHRWSRLRTKATTSLLKVTMSVMMPKARMTPRRGRKIFGTNCHQHRRMIGSCNLSPQHQVRCSPFQ